MQACLLWNNASLGGNEIQIDKVGSNNEAQFSARKTEFKPFDDIFF